MASTLGGLSSIAQAAGTDTRYNLDPDFPVRVEDAFPTGYNTVYAKFISRFAEAQNGTDITTLQPEVAWGFAPNLDLHLSAPFYVGDGNRDGSGNINANVQWMFLEQHEGDWFPSIAVEGDAIFPSGLHANGVDTILQLNATETLTWAPSFDEVHLNLTWNHNFEAGDGDRSDYYNVILGYSRRIFDKTVLIGDVLWEQQVAHDTNDQIAELGLIQKLTDNIQISGGMGVGLGDSAPNYTATVGIIISN
ncbi:MAG: transporter [Tepidisphaeraceae bacterium]